MSELSLYRKRFIPNELVCLKDDIILLQEDNLIVTKWKALHPRKDIAGGISAYFLDTGIKVSKVFNKEHQLVYWYCDIVQMKEGPNPDTLIFEDLLVDVVLREDGTVKILDLDELAQALELHLITEQEVAKALRILDYLLNIIYQGQFDSLKEPVNRFQEL
ncbi:MAG TPA: DUF402 domain-containing protein [Mobilitalea sp.]|nr:DUF402 domain-containing protein [Mobilitalea sp.]